MFSQCGKFRNYGASVSLFFRADRGETLQKNAFLYNKDGMYFARDTAIYGLCFKFSV